jgi:tRNA (adenine37-N6)-methyltransferase
MNITLEPIGMFSCPQKERYQVARQGGLLEGISGEIQLFPHHNYEQALEGIDGFDHIWVIYQFHRNTHWKPKVFPPRGDQKQGVFSTRSPHRPNFIGLSRVKLLRVNGLILSIEDHDLIDGTPVIDIKPYLNYCDAEPSARQGWLDDLEGSDKKYTIFWSEKSKKQVTFLMGHGIDMESALQPRLALHPYPRKSNRIKKLENDRYLAAYKSWRILYIVEVETMEVHILEVQSGYRSEDLIDDLQDRWGDFWLHREFMRVLFN